MTRCHSKSKVRKVLLELGIILFGTLRTSDSLIWGIQRQGVADWTSLTHHSSPSPNIQVAVEGANKNDRHCSTRSKSPYSSLLKSNDVVQSINLDFLKKAEIPVKKRNVFGWSKTSIPSSSPQIIMAKSRTKKTITQLPFSILSHGKQKMEGVFVIERLPMDTLNLKRPITTATYHQYYATLESFYKNDRGKQQPVFYKSQKLSELIK